MTCCRLLPGLMLVCVVVPNCCLAQFDEEADLIPGLLGVYSAGEKSIEKIDVTLSHSWGRSSPDERLPQGAFNVEWTSQLLLREEAVYRFHAFAEGSVRMEVDGEGVLAGEREQLGWIHGDPIELSFGLLELRVEYQKIGEAGRVQLFWSSDTFPLEPVPPHLLFREEGRPDLAQWDRGRELFAAHRCNRCHRRADEVQSPSAPSLVHVTTGLHDGWLVDKMLDRHAEAAHARMPSFGFTYDEARAVAAYLSRTAQPVELPDVPPVPTGKNAPPAGDLLVKSIGCLACHTVGETGQSSTFSGGDLTAIGEKRTVGWLSKWLADPGALNPDHRMPLIRLSESERSQIARELASWIRADASTSRDPEDAAADDDLVLRGRELVDRSRCAACHTIPDLKADLSGIPTLAQDDNNWERSCLSAADPNAGRPLYRNIDAEAIQNYVESRIGDLSPTSDRHRGLMVLQEHNCLGCHERDLGTGIVSVAGRLERTDERFRGQSQALIPPSLTAVGDKLHEKSLTLAVRGEQQPARLPWLQVRMPRFEHDPEDQSVLTNYLITHDRIPDGAPPSRSNETGHGESSAAEAEQMLTTGHALVGAGGFNCVACHKFGEYEPRNVALGTKGCDLFLLKERMREEYFHRWTRAPLRVIPGIEMPNFNKPVTGVLEGDIDRQLTAVWDAMNDPRFTAPTNPTQVEQLLTVQPGVRPQVVRDVFTVTHGNGGGYIARPIAVGFSNGHSFLFDLDQVAIRGWTLGDFARQRTEGKSWYWDLAGLEVATGFTGGCELSLQHLRSERVIPPLEDHGRRAKLLRYEIGAETVEWGQSLSFDVEGQIVGVTLTQSVAPIFGTEHYAGWERTISTSQVPEGYQLLLARPAIQPVLSNVEIEADGELVHSDSQTGESRSLWVVPRTAEGHRIHQRFTCSAVRPTTPPPVRPELPRIAGEVTTVPGMTGIRLPLPSSIMPTALARLGDGRLMFTSLKGHVYSAEDSDGDGLADLLTELEQGLAAPFGIMPFRDGLLVAHKPELLWIRDVDGPAPAARREIWADGWGYSDDYHDWTTGPVTDGQGSLYLGIGSNYSQKGRSVDTSRWRGTVLRIDEDRHIEAFATELRYPQGIATDTHGRLFVSDQQGVANTFNEINHVREGRRYGVKALFDDDSPAPETRASVQVPHPWTRSVNGIFFLPEEVAGPLAPFAGHGIGCEYNGKFLIRFTFDEVNGELQGACYEFSRIPRNDETQSFLGPMCGLATSSGEVYVGSIFDSGWLGGPNTGEIVRLTPNGDEVPNGIRVLRATPDGFEIEFLRTLDRSIAETPTNYTISGYTRVWEGAYATPDSGRYAPAVTNATLDADGLTVRLTVDELRERYVYELSCSGLATEGAQLFPDAAHYTMNRVPESAVE